jgi:hypothetical protein
VVFAFLDDGANAGGRGLKPFIDEKIGIIGFEKV